MSYTSSVEAQQMCSMTSNLCVRSREPILFETLWVNTLVMLCRLLPGSYSFFAFVLLESYLSRGDSDTHSKMNVDTDKEKHTPYVMHLAPSLYV